MQMLNRDEIIKLIKEKPLHAGIAGVVILIVFILILTSLFGGGKQGKAAATAKAIKGPLRISIIENGTIQPKEKIIKMRLRVIPRLSI